MNGDTVKLPMSDVGIVFPENNWTMGIDDVPEDARARSIDLSVSRLLSALVVKPVAKKFDPEICELVVATSA